ncbi:MAG: hypothetical protein F4Y44_07770 [Chloroflexi bacterium]|nr:hypothetical protein [Chloroflexota bacterium]
MLLRKRIRLSVFIVAAVLLVILAAAIPSEGQANGGGSESLTVLVMDEGESGSVFTVVWADDQACSASYNVYLDGAESSTVGLPENATIDDSGRIHLASAASSDTHVSVSFTAIFSALDASSLTVSVFCGNDSGSGREVATVDDVKVDSDTRRPIQGAYARAPSESSLQSGVISGPLGSSSLDNFSLAIAGHGGDLPQYSGDDVPDYAQLLPILSDGDGNSSFAASGGTRRFVLENTDVKEETHSSISTTIADNGATGSTFTITWVDAGTCTGNYSLYLDNIDSNGVGLPSSATQDSDGRVHLGAVAASTDPLQKVSAFSTVKAVSDGDHLALRIYCDDDSGREVDSDELPIDSTSLRPIAGTYSSMPGITDFQINGTAQIRFNPYKTAEEYDYTWNVGLADVATIKPVLKDGYSATYYGSTKNVYGFTLNGVEISKFATWSFNGAVTVTDDDETEDDFQFRFDDNDPEGTDMFWLNVSRGDYHIGHYYNFFVIRRAAVTGSTTLDYAENGTDPIGTYSISDPARDYNWRLASRTGEGKEDDKDAFYITKNNDGNGVLSFATSPDYETPTDSSSPADNVYHTNVLGWEVHPILGYWYGNYYGRSEVQVTVTDVDPE